MDLIAIKIQDEFLELPDSVSVSFDWYNPIFDTEVIKGQFSYPFTISAKSKVNKRLLQRPVDERNINKDPKRIDCILYLGGIQYSAYIRVLSATDLEYSVSVFQKNALLTEIKDKSITQLDLGSVGTPPATIYRWVDFVNESQNFDDFDFILYINNVRYRLFDVYTPPFGLTNHTQKLNLLIDLINADTDTHFLVASIGDTYSGKISMRLTSIIPGISAPFNVRRYPNPMLTPPSPTSDSRSFRCYKVFPSYTENDTFDYMMEVSADATNSSLFTFSPILTEGFFETPPSGFDAVLNNYDYQNAVYYKNDFTFPEKFSVAPQVRMVSLLKNLFSLAGYTFQGPLLQETDINKIVLFNINTIDLLYYTPKEETTSIEEYTLKLINVWAPFIEAKKCLPDVTVSQLLNYFRAMFAVAIIPYSNTGEAYAITLRDVILNPETINISSYELKGREGAQNDIYGYRLKWAKDTNDALMEELCPELDGYNVKEPVATFADLSPLGNETNDVRLVIDENKYYRAVKNTDPVDPFWVWEFLAINIYNFQTGEADYSDVETGSSPYLMSVNEGFKLPYIKQPGNSAAYNQTGNDFGLRFMYYRGLVGFTLVGLGFFEVPTITRDEFDHDGNNVFARTMEFDGPKGLYETMHKAWANHLINTKPVTKVFNFPITFLNQLRWEKTYRSSGVNYLIKKVSFTVTKKKISSTTAELTTK